jgi:hypothetical protein
VLPVNLDFTSNGPTNVLIAPLLANTGRELTSSPRNSLYYAYTKLLSRACLPQAGAAEGPAFFSIGIVLAAPTC